MNRLPSNDAAALREADALHKLAAVSCARTMRLQAERAALAERERVLEQAMQAQQLDEALLAQQQGQWAGAWQSWAQAGGPLRSAMALRNDKLLLNEMAALVARARADLLHRSECLAAEIGQWGRAWYAAQEFGRSLTERRRLLGLAQQRADERLRDEEALTAFASASRHGRDRPCTPPH